MGVITKFLEQEEERLLWFRRGEERWWAGLGGTRGRGKWEQEDRPHGHCSWVLLSKCCCFSFCSVAFSNLSCLVSSRDTGFFRHFIFQAFSYQTVQVHQVLDAQLSFPLFPFSIFPRVLDISHYKSDFSLSLCLCVCICVECPWRPGESDSFTINQLQTVGSHLTWMLLSWTWIYKRACTLNHGTLSSPSVGWLLNTSDRQYTMTAAYRGFAWSWLSCHV